MKTPRVLADTGPRSRTRRLIPWVVGASAGLVGWTIASSSDESHTWMRVARDSTYDISIDTGRIKRYGNYSNTYVVWYQTNHAVAHLYKDKKFDREVVESILDCGRLKFKIASVDMFLGARWHVERQRESSGELGRQLWRDVEHGTLEARVGQAACDYARGRVSRASR